MTVHVAQKRGVHLKILSGEKTLRKCNPPDFNFIPVKNNLTNKKNPYGAMLICVHFHCSKQYMKTKKIQHYILWAKQLYYLLLFTWGPLVCLNYDPG